MNTSILPKYTIGELSKYDIMDVMDQWFILASCQQVSHTGLSAVPDSVVTLRSWAVKSLSGEWRTMKL